jgi:hypothetical protein
MTYLFLCELCGLIFFSVNSVLNLDFLPASSALPPSSTATNPQRTQCRAPTTRARQAAAHLTAIDATSNAVPAGLLPYPSPVSAQQQKTLV